MDRHLPPDTNPADIGLLTRRIVELETENARLRQAAVAFGELAERLNERLRAERGGADRRRRRPAPDRSPHDFRID